MQILESIQSEACEEFLENYDESLTLFEDANKQKEEEEYQQAINLYRKCLERDPMNAKLNAHVLLRITECQERLGNSNDALKDLSKALKYRPRYPDARLKRGEIYLSMQKYEEAIEDLQEAMDLAVWM